MTQNQKIFQRQIFITNEHGSWVFLLSPLLIGIFAGQSWSLDAVILVMGALVGFLIRHPITIAVKVLSGRRSKADLRPAGWAILIYSLVGVLMVGGLVLRGLSYLLILAVPGIFVFVWHLYLVYNLYVYLQLAQREQKQIPSVKDRFRLGWRAALYSSFNLLTAILLSTAGVIPTWIFTPYLLQWSETFRGIYNPALGVKPTKIGIRQLIISSLFTLLFILAWRI